MSLISLILGSLPGLLLPFAILLVLPAGSADMLVLTIATATIVASVTASTYESALIASFGLAISGGGRIRSSDFRRAQRRSLISGAPLGFVLYPIVTLLYLIQEGPGSSSDNLWVALGLLAFPVLASQSAVYSGYLISAGKIPAVLLSNALRGGPTLLLLCVTREPIILSAAYSVGEGLRIAFLDYHARRSLGQQVASGGVDAALFVLPTVRSWLHQVGSMSTSMVTSLVPRYFLAVGPAGSLAKGASAERLLFGANQVATSMVILPAVAQLAPAMRGLSSGEVRAVIIRQMRSVFLLSLGVAVFAELAVSVSMPFIAGSTNESFVSALHWGQILLIGVPFLSVNVWGARVLTLSDQTRYLVLFSILLALTMVSSCWALTSVFGAIGAIYSMLFVNVLAGICYAVCCVSVAPEAISGRMRRQVVDVSYGGV